MRQLKKKASVATVGLTSKLGYFLFQDLLLSTWELEYLKRHTKGALFKAKERFLAHRLLLLTAGSGKKKKKKVLSKLKRLLVKKGLTVFNLLIFKKWTTCTYHKFWSFETSDSLSRYKTNTWIKFALFILHCLPSFHFCKTGMWACS